MSWDAPFAPKGPTYLVGTQPVQVLVTDGSLTVSYRISSLSTSRQYITWLPFTAAQPTIPIATPTAVAPQANTIGMAAGATETFNLPANAWFRADAAGAFEVTPGEGL